MALGAIAGVVSALASAAGTGYSIWQSRQEQGDLPAGWGNWLRAAGPGSLAMGQMIYNPLFEGTKPPYGAGVPYQWQPRASVQGIYSNYLNRQYGLPERVARGMSSQAMQPLRMPQLPGGMAGPAQIQAGLRGSLEPGQIAQSFAGARAPQGLRQLDYLQGAQQVASFNQWRTQQLGRILG